MKSDRFENEEPGCRRRRMSLEQRIRLLVRRYRRAKRRKQKRLQENEPPRRHRRPRITFAALQDL